jgi:catechol 2,3-dioxygenase-like lactoylglutathione lyase family enzyme
MSVLSSGVDIAYPGSLVHTIDVMAVERMDHVGIVVDDLEDAIEFFVELGLERGGRGTVDGPWVERIVGLDDVRVDFAFVKTSDGRGQLELITFDNPPSPDGDADAPANVPGIRHLCFAVDDIHDTVARLQARGSQLVGKVTNYDDQFWLCYIRGPEGIIVELAEKIAK